MLNVKFRFTGPSPQAVLDRLLTSKIVKKLDDGLIFEADVFGKGIKISLLSQAEFVEVLEPKELRDRFAKVSKKQSRKPRI
ncbi:WYL domain-containing protein [Lysinibacillus sp. NPDC093216]|uniref:WYL domain-containing protein n=1 Tax=Lysinibacillus sp. NPDC093216 TaxID=3390576 RepID=UPI003CFE734C